MGDSNLFYSLVSIFLMTLGGAASFIYDLELQAKMTPCELIRYHGYPCDVTYATTEDGYVLQVIRIPNGINGNESSTRDGVNTTCLRPPVLLLSPLFTGADIYFLNFPWQSIDHGFDVWAMNSREVRKYSNHTSLSQSDPKYWQWSFDEIGRFDTAATVDLILNISGCPKITILGFSQGAMVSLVLLSRRPDYNDRVNLLVAYGPVANLTYVGTPFSLLLPSIPVLAPIVYPLTDAGYFGANNGMRQTLSLGCEIFHGDICSVAFTFTEVTSPYQFNETREPMYVGHVPFGTSIQNLNHYYQVYHTKNFVMYDHGATENKKLYGQTTPPTYPLERIRLPVAIFSSSGDTAGDKHDVDDLISRLGSNVVLHHVVPQETFRHLDFATGYRAFDILHDVAIKTIQKYAV